MEYILIKLNKYIRCSIEPEFNFERSCFRINKISPNKISHMRADQKDNLLNQNKFYKLMYKQGPVSLQNA